MLLTARTRAGRLDGRASATSPRGSRRCRWSTLAPPDDALLRAVLVKLFADRQLAVDESLVGYLVTRIERSFAGARAAVARLDQEAMRQQRPLTRALAAELLRVGERLTNAPGRGASCHRAVTKRDHQSGDSTASQMPWIAAKLLF